MRPHPSKHLVLEEWSETSIPKERATQPLANGVQAFLQKNGLDKREIELRILKEWHRIVGDFNAKNSQPLGIRNRILTVGVTHSVFLFEFQRQKLNWKQKINQYFSKPLVKDIVFKSSI
ncbi:MAG: DUF721 domain-containing protein [Verrucomicrobiae bacterium]|nr:DUF721 domain-containing protein [Verrucomicrobiae bacterium]